MTSNKAVRAKLADLDGLRDATDRCVVESNRYSLAINSIVQDICREHDSFFLSASVERSLRKLRTFTDDHLQWVMDRHLLSGYNCQHQEIEFDEMADYIIEQGSPEIQWLASRFTPVHKDGIPLGGI